MERYLEAKGVYKDLGAHLSGDGRRLLLEMPTGRVLGGRSTERNVAVANDIDYLGVAPNGRDWIFDRKTGEFYQNVGGTLAPVFPKGTAEGANEIVLVRGRNYPTDRDRVA